MIKYYTYNFFEFDWGSSQNAFNMFLIGLTQPVCRLSLSSSSKWVDRGRRASNTVSEKPETSRLKYCYDHVSILLQATVNFPEFNISIV